MSVEDARLLESVKQWDLSAHPATICWWLLIFRHPSNPENRSKSDIQLYYIKTLHKQINNCSLQISIYHISEFVSE